MMRSLSFASPVRLALAALALWAAPGQARAEGEGQEEAPPAAPLSANDYDQMGLEDLLNVGTTTATKTERSIENSPSILTVITRQDLERLGARQLADVLPFVPGFYEVASQLDRNFSVRGIHAASAQHFAVLVDGVAMNDFLTSSVALESFSLEYVDRIEIIRGPGSALYGASALMGVVNLITLSGAKRPGVRVGTSFGNGTFWRQELSYGADLGEKRSFLASLTVWGDDGRTRGVSASEDVLLPRNGVNISDGISEGEDLTRPRSGASVRVGQHRPSVDLFLKYTEDEKWTLRASYAREGRVLQRSYLQSLLGPDELARPEYTVQRLVVDVERVFGQADKWGRLLVRPSVALHLHEMNSPRIARDFYGDPEITRNPLMDANSVFYGWSGNDLRVMGSLEYLLALPDFAFFHESTIMAGLAPEYDLLYGYSQRRCFLDTTGAVASPSPLGTGADLACLDELFIQQGLVIDEYGNILEDKSSGHAGNASEWRLGGFLQLSTFFPHDIGLVLAGRLDYHPDYGDRFSPRVSLMAPIAGGVYSKAQVSSAFIYPALLYRLGNRMADYIGNPGVRPQSVTSYELLLGLKRDFFRVEVNGYLNQVRDFLTYDLRRNAQTGRYMFSNQGNLDIAGAELSAVASLLENRLSISLNGSWLEPLPSTDAKFVVDGKLGGPTKAPELTASLSLGGVPLRTERVSLGLTATLLYATAVAGATVNEAVYTDVVATDGTLVSSRSASDYPTETLQLDVSASLTFRREWKLTVAGTNLLGGRHYRPGSTMVPTLLDGRRVVATLSYQY